MTWAGRGNAYRAVKVDTVANQYTAFHKNKM